MNALDLNLISLNNAWNKHGEFFSNDKTSIDDDKEESIKAAQQQHSGSITFLLFITLITLAITVWALYSIIKFWDKIPQWAKVLGIIGLLCFPLLTIVVVYASKQP
jgi:hypothetical protein